MNNMHKIVNNTLSLQQVLPMSPIPRNSSWQLLNDAQLIRNPTPIFLPRNGSQPRIIRVVKPGYNVVRWITSINRNYTFSSLFSSFKKCVKQRLGLQHHNRELTQMGVSSSNGRPSLLHQQSETKEWHFYQEFNL